MHFNHHFQALFAGSLILILAFTTSASSAPPSPPVPVSPPVLSTATPTITANLANPIISSQFQLGVNNGLRTLCLGPQSSNQLPGNHASTASPSQALTSIMQQLQPSSVGATAAESLSTVTKVTTEATAYKTELLKISTVTAWIDVLSFLDVGSGTHTGTTFGARASLGIEERARENEEILVTVTRTQLATQTAVVKEVPVTALVYVLSYPDPSLTDAPDTTADPNPAPTLLRAGNGTNVSQNPTNQQAASQYQAEMLQAFKDGYELGKEMENPCVPAPAPAVGAVGKREDVWKDLGDGVLDVLGVGPDDTGSGKKLRRQNRDGPEKRRGSSGGRGSSRGPGTAPIVVVSGTLSPTHMTALHNLWITALVIGFLALRAGASTAGFSDSSSSVLSTSIGPKASDPAESLPSNSSSIITDTSGSPTDLRLESLTSLENRKGGGSAAAARAAARAAAANNISGATVRPSTTPVRILLVVALLFVLFTTRVTAGTTADVGSVVVDNLAVTRDTIATVTETLKSREVDPGSTLGGSLGDSDEVKKDHSNSDDGWGNHGWDSSYSGANPHSMAPIPWVFWIIVLITSFITMGANATTVDSGINSPAVTEPDKSLTQFTSPSQSPNHETKRITNKSSTPFIAARQHLSGGGYDITPGNVNGPEYHIEPNQLCSAEYNYNCGDASSAAELPIKLPLLALYFSFGWGFFGAAGSAITTTRDTTDFLDLEDSSPTYPPSNTCTTTTLLPAFISGTGSPVAEMNARHTETKNARPIKHVRFLLPNQRRSSSAEESQRTRFMRDLNNATRRPRSYSTPTPPTPLTPRHHTSSILTTPSNGRTTKPKPKDNANRRPRPCSASIPRSILTTASIALVFAISISGCTALPSLSAPEASSTISLPTHILRSVDTGLPSSTALAHREEQAKNVQDSHTEKKRACPQYGCPHSSSPKARSSLIWPSLPLLLILLNYITGATTSDSASALEPLSTNLTQLCEDGLDPSPTGSPPNTINVQPGTLQAAQAAEGFPVTSETASNTRDIPIARRVATGATLQNTSKATRSRLPSPLLLFGIIALFFTTQISALTLGSSAMARRALPDIHARSNLPERPAMEPEPVPVTLSRTLEMSETVVSRSDSYFEYCVQMTDEDAKEDCYEYISVEYGLERSETVAFRSESRVDDWVQIPSEKGEEEGEEGCFEDIDDGVEGSDEAFHENHAVRSTTEPVSHPRKLKRSNPTASGSDPRHCDSLDTAEARDICLCRQAPTEEERDRCLVAMYDGTEGANPNAGRRNLAARSIPTPMPGPTLVIPIATPDRPQNSPSNTPGNPKVDYCNKIPEKEARENCLRTRAIHSRNLDAAETIARRQDSLFPECRQFSTKSAQEYCQSQYSDGNSVAGEVGGNKARELGGDDSTPTPAPIPDPLPDVPVPDTPGNSGADPCDHPGDEESRVGCAAVMAAGPMSSLNHPRNPDAAEIIASRSNPVTATGEDVTQDAEELPGSNPSTSGHGIHRRDGDSADVKAHRQKIIIGVVVGVAAIVTILGIVALKASGGGGGCGWGGCDGCDCSC